ncbi:TPA: hypothetical protein DDW69_04675 [candidate division CPR2 bacterium]|uniref:NHL repeat containing protein n=1 Tax=candidate division CPR2 bacterium GW2011_GWC1_41_48 TaxID=1618344 RepID=A0A0G0W8M0_UNCC2|nr:MAG: hypothetical protein UT47_C0002G0187 [candidate division CPR2 bacterium GW2011_GWC2_39_35]KKR28543.1 MAG: hypothetical protein UT60_C0018G0013 [candidate division CPR2 bacterium GW2011_GWD2_39_7]KKS09339.1 MAG: hypothetical protein UU65_C0002G0117 [candidate division CPR2 bacterium GW2011_GWC1_41_48]OGB72815.1 MAG: hypothetical protein A2Y26_04870 [candidate division CPR2 bacterium GWD2_39_7]HBG82095.1 hypothetical protein [candidate division CPR2 bacterium]
MLKVLGKEEIWDKNVLFDSKAVIGEIRDIDTNSSGTIGITDSDGFVRLYDRRGNSRTVIDGTMNESYGLYRPSGIHLCVHGLVWVTSMANQVVSRFNLKGDHIDSWGGYGSEDGKFNDPLFITGHAGNRYIADNGNARIQAYDKRNNKWLTFAKLSLPTVGIACDLIGNMYAIELGDKLLKLSSTGALLEQKIIFVSDDDLGLIESMTIARRYGIMFLYGTEIGLKAYDLKSHQIIDGWDDEADIIKEIPYISGMSFDNVESALYLVDPVNCRVVKLFTERHSLERTRKKQYCYGGS